MSTVEELQKQLKDAEARKQKLSEALESDRAAARAKNEREANQKALKAAASVPEKLARHMVLEVSLKNALRRHDGVALELVALWNTIREKTKRYREVVGVLKAKHGRGDLGIPLESCGEKHLNQGFLNRVNAVIGQEKGAER